MAAVFSLKIVRFGKLVGYLEMNLTEFWIRFSQNVAAYESLCTGPLLNVLCMWN